MKKIIVILISLFLPFTTYANTEPYTVNVGAILALSGDAAYFGEAVKNGITLAHNSLEPELKKRIKIHFEDDRAESRLTISAFQKLKSSNDLDVIINTSSGTGKALSPITDRSKIPLIAIASDPQVIQGRSHAVNLWVTPDKEAQLAVEESVKRGYKKIARISAIHEFTLECAKQYDRFSEGKIETVLKQEYQKNERDFRAFLTKVRSQKDLDAIFVNLFFGQAGVFARQAREMGVDLPLFTFELFEDPSELKLSNGALIDQWYVNAEEPEGWYKEKYMKNFRDASFVFSANGYDALMLIAETIRNSSEKPDINSFLHSVKDFTGALGTYSATGANTFTLPAAIKIVTHDS